MIAYRITVKLMDPESTIIEYGDIGYEMYFMVKGEAGVYAKDRHYNT